MKNGYSTKYFILKRQYYNLRKERSKIEIPL